MAGAELWRTCCSGSARLRTSYIQTWRLEVPTTMRLLVTAMVKILSGRFEVDTQLFCRISHTFMVLSQLPETQHPNSFCQHTALTAFSCSPITCSVSCVREQAKRAEAHNLSVLGLPRQMKW